MTTPAGLSRAVLRTRRGTGFLAAGVLPHLKVAEIIASGKAIGFSLREILVFLDEMTDGSLDHAKVQQSLRAKIDLIDSQIASLKKTKKLVQKQIDYCREAEQNALRMPVPSSSTPLV